jgi:uncharacterized protein (DUF2141 family)
MKLISLFFIFLLVMAFRMPMVNSNTATIIIDPIIEGKGNLSIGIYNSAESFPKNGHAAYAKDVKAIKGTQKIEFTNLPDGNYAIAVFHDLNSNKKLDKNFFGVPSEPYGFSNNVKHAISAPTFDESKVTIKGGHNLTVSITLQ